MTCYRDRTGSKDEGGDGRFTGAESWSGGSSAAVDYTQNDVAGSYDGFHCITGSMRPLPALGDSLMRGEMWVSSARS